jgi:glycosyltransferase involved in cell wall biosynthesis
VLRIVIDARSVVAKKSGIGNYVESLVRHLVPLLRDERLLLLRHPQHGVGEPFDERIQELVFPGETKSVSTVFRLGRRHRFADRDLYHSPADLVPLGIRCPWVVTIHDLMWVEAPQLASAFLPVRLANGVWYRLNITRAIQGAREVIAISEATRRAIGRIYPEHVHKVTVIRHGLDVARYAAGKKQPRALIEAWVPAAVRYSLIVGQGSPYKNHAGMLRAFAEATRDEPDHKLVLVRRFSRIDREMTGLLARPDVQRKVIHIPFVADEVLLSLYQHAHMLLFASHYEGFGLPALEAMALGTPVLGSTAEAVREVTGDAALHAVAADERDMVQKIRELSRNAGLRSALVAAGFRRVRDFSWERSAAAHLEVYRSACRAR